MKGFAAGAMRRCDAGFDGTVANRRIGAEILMCSRHVSIHFLGSGLFRRPGARFLPNFPNRLRAQPQKQATRRSSLDVLLLHQDTFQTLDL
jgi:hypothetical protein